MPGASRIVYSQIHVDGARRPKMLVFVLILMCDICYATAGISGDASIWEWEEKRRAAAREAVEDARNLLEKRRDKFLSYIPSGRAHTLSEEVAIRVLSDPTTAFLFRSDVETREIVTSVETLSTLSKFAMASALSTTFSNLGDSWLKDYLLYVRSVPSRDVIIDPLRASGYLTENLKFKAGLEKAELEKMFTAYSDILDGMLMFLVGHELGHFEIPLPSDFGDEQLRAVEEKADKFAIEILLAGEVNRGTQEPFYLKGPVVLFLGWLLAFEEGRDSVSSGSHPPDHTRALTASNAILSSINTLAIDGAEKQQITNAGLTLKNLMEEVDKNPVEFIRELEKEAGQVKLTDLFRP